jgi:dipeptidyl aminopeptidase/acylaminoacyl peptidase
MLVVLLMRHSRIIVFRRTIMPEANKRPITAEDLYDFNKISGTSISPDGKSVVYAVHRVDAKTEKKYSNLWLAAADGKAPPRQFTYGDQNDGGARWSPDGQQIAFLTNRGDKEKPAQIYLIPFLGGEARPLTKIDGSIGSFSWSPDGKRLLCTVRKIDADVLEREKDEQKKKLGTVYRHYDRLFYKLDGYGYLPKERTHLWLIDAESGEGKQLTDHAIWDEQDPTWSPDGHSIAFVSNRSPEPDMTPDLVELFILSADTGEMRKIETPVGSKGHPSFSPDGKLIAYYAQEGEGQDYRNINVWIVPVDGSAPACSLTGPYDIQADGWTINDLAEADSMPPTWSNDGKTIYYPAVYHGSTLLQTIAISGEKPDTLIGEGGAIAGFCFNRDQTRMAYAYGKIDSMVQVITRDLPGGAERQLTHQNQVMLDSIELSQIEEVWFKGPDGNDLQGWIMKPPGFDPSKKYPSIMEIHGGPITQYGKLFMHEFYFLSAAGYVVYFTNPRGGQGYGEAHTQAIWGDWGNRDNADLMAWADYVEKLPYIDTARMGVTGGSYGGYMTVWIIGHTQRFKAAVTQRCVSNFISMWGSSDFNWSFQKELNDKPPFEALQFYWDHSPIAYIGNAKTPTLVIHNEMDHRCPIEQGEQVFVALKRLGVETEFVRFPEEFHGLSRGGRTDRRIARLKHILRWFDKYLK